MIDPGKIHTRQQLTDQLAGLFHRGEWSHQRLAAAAELSPSTVLGIVKGTSGIPRAGSLRAFVTACGQLPGPWLVARRRVIEAEKFAANEERRDRDGLVTVGCPGAAAGCAASRAGGRVAHQDRPRGATRC